MIFLLQKWTMKFTTLTNNWYNSVRVTRMIQLNIKKTLKGNQGFVQMFMWWMVCIRKLIELLVDTFSILREIGNSCYSVLLLGNHGTDVKKWWCYEVLQSTMTWYMKFLTPSYPLQYAKRLLTYLQGKQ